LANFIVTHLHKLNKIKYLILLGVIFMAEEDRGLFFGGSFIWIIIIIILIICLCPVFFKPDHCKR